MNVAFFTDTFLPKFDGIVTSVLNTAGELIRRGHRVLIVAPRIRKEQDEEIKKHNPDLEFMLIPGVPALFYPDFRLTPPAAPWVISRLKKFQPDVLHFHTPFTMGFEAIVASRILKKPLVGTFHTYFGETEYLKIVNLHWVPGLVELGWAFSNFYHNRCDVTISPSRFTAEELIRKKIKSPVRIISNGIPLKEARSLSEAEKILIRQKYNLKEKVMLFVGRVSEEKCLDVLIKASAEVFKKRQDVSLLIVGDGPGLGRVKKLIKELSVEDSIILSGYVPHDELIDSGIFEISSFFVTASTSENQPMTIIESCMLGLPLIGVNARGVPEMIDKNGFIAEPGNYNEIAGYMLRLLEDDYLRSEMSAASLKQGKKYDIKNTTDEMLALYEELIRSGRGFSKKQQDKL